ncbi:MAG: hypothetical protein H6693_01180 [Candidatus Latescibacteria bacterium]|nr:hypothetical protein [Candidatus Latescibacterota bacterium]
MKEIRNTTAGPLRLTLPGGKTLHLSPGKVAQVADKALERASLKALVASGEIEVLGEGDHPEGIGPAASGAEQTHGQSRSPFRRRSGER